MLFLNDVQSVVEHTQPDMAHAVVQLIAMRHTVDSPKINHWAHARKNQTWPASWEAYSPNAGPGKDPEMNMLLLHSQC